jgi:hypothetical protein
MYKSMQRDGVYGYGTGEVSNATTTEDDFNRVAVWSGWQHSEHVR